MSTPLTYNNPTPDNPLPLKTLPPSPSGSPPKQRLTDASHAQDLYWTLHEAARPRLAKAAVMQGNFDGNPPYDPRKMRQSAQAWRPNFNTLEGASRLEAAKVPYYDLLTSSPALADAQTDVAEAEVDAATASRIRSSAFDRMLKSYPSFDSNFWTCFNDFVGFNKGFLWFPRPDSWHFKRLPWWRVYFPDGTSTDPDEWELFCIEHRWSVHKLYAFIKDEEAATKAGWNVEQVWKAIRLAAPDNVVNSLTSPMDFQREVRDNTLYMSAKLGTVQAASVYVREFNGSWSRMMVQTQIGTERTGTSGAPMSPLEKAKATTRTTNSTGLDTDSTLRPDQWLFNKANVASSLWQIMCPFIFETGDGSINELAGLGKKIISISQAKDRLANEQVSGAFMRSTIVLQPVTGAAQAKTNLIHFGNGVMVTPAGYTIQPGTIFGDLQGPLAVSADLDSRLDKNTGIYRPGFEKPRGNPETAQAAQIRFSQATVLTNSAVNRFYVQVDRFYEEIYRRATLSLPKTSSDPGIQASLDFQEECRKAGLSKRQIDDMQPGSVRAVRAIGNGSPMMRQQTMAALAQYVPFFGPRGLNNWLCDSIAAFAGPQAVNRYRPLEDQHQEPTKATREAVSENNDMQTGAQVLWLESDDHEEHAKAHLTAAAGAVQSVQQGADPAMPFTFLQLALPHAAQHISKVPREQMRKALEDAYKKIADGAKDVYAAAEQAVKQKGQQQQMTFDQQVAMMEAQHRAQLSEFKAGSLIDLKKKRQDAELALKQQQQTSEGALKDATTGADVQRQTAATVAAIQQERAKTLAGIEHERMKTEAQVEAARRKAEMVEKKGDDK